MPPYLAAEITDCIIGFVWPDKRGLCACSLVCQDWLPASRHHLFSNITTSPTSYDMLVEQLNHSSSMRACLPSVHTFAFQAPLAVKPSDDLSIAMANWTKGQRFILDFSGHLPNLRRAEFMATFFHTKMHPRLHLALHNFRKLRELSLAYCHFSSFNSLRRMLVALPGLASLTMRFLAWTSISFPSVPTATRPPAQASPALEHLSLALKAYDIPDPDSLIDWLISIPTPSRISLSMVGFQAYGNVEPPYGALRFMNCLSSPSSVRDLTISQFEIEGHHFDLSPLVNLENLDLGLAGDPYSWPLLPAPHWDVLCRMLQDVRSPLRRLRLSVYCYVPADGDVGVRELDPAFVKGMEGLDPVLEGKAFRHLRAVAFATMTQFLSAQDPTSFDDRSLCSEEPFREAVRVRLPKLYARGVTMFAF